MKELFTQETLRQIQEENKENWEKFWEVNSQLKTGEK